uniref:Secreted protein n=1 Tax=Anguilla anguilla TaxID=7936 RepID=A0A0E9W8X3_ANGAN
MWWIVFLLHYLLFSKMYIQEIHCQSNPPSSLCDFSTVNSKNYLFIYCIYQHCLNLSSSIYSNHLLKLLI